MLTGVPLFNGFDAKMRDAAAHEVQDSCNGHPQKSGQYHYHSLSACIKDVSEKTVIGYALDGYPITGPMVAPGRYLTTANLDECHGITSEIIEDGAKKITYHYVMTQDFPYSVSCFRGTPTRMGPVRRRQSQPNTYECRAKQIRCQMAFIKNIWTLQKSKPRNGTRAALTACRKWPAAKRSTFRRCRRSRPAKPSPLAMVIASDRNAALLRAAAI